MAGSRVSLIIVSVNKMIENEPRESRATSDSEVSSRFSSSEALGFFFLLVVFLAAFLAALAFLAAS